MPRSQRWSKLFSLVLPGALFLGGCTDSGGFLTVDFDRLDVNEITWESIDTDFVFQVDNPNPIGIELARFDYQLELSGVEVASGADPDGLVVDSLSPSEISLPMSAAFADIYDMVDVQRGADELPFRLDGSFGFDTPMGIMELPFDAEGTFPALRAPSVRFGQLELGHVGLTHVELNVELDIDNDHGASLWFTEFEYELALSGHRVASGLIDDLGEVPGSGSSTVVVPVIVDLLDTGLALSDILGSGSTDVDLVATTQVQTPFGILPLSLTDSGNVVLE